MAKINTGTITAGGDGSWTSNAITLTVGANRTYMRVNGAQVLYRDFTVAAASQFGKTTSTGTATNFPANANIVSICLFTGFPGGTVSTGKVYYATANTGGYKMVVYTGTAGLSNTKTLVGVSDAVTNPSTSVWTTFTFSTPLNLSAGDYWIGMLTNATSGGQSPGDTTGSNEYWNETYETPAASAVPSGASGATSSIQKAIYLEYV